MPTNKTSKWMLRSGTIVEDLLEQLHTGIATNVLDTGCNKTEELFSDAEWEEIKLSAALPILSPTIPPILGDISELDALSSEILRNPDTENHWLGYVLSNLARIYGDGLQSYCHGEKNYECIWSSVVDVSLYKTDLYVARGELESDLMKNSKNSNRSPGQGIIRCKRYDGIVKCKRTSRLPEPDEFAFFEVSSKPAKSWTTKRLNDEQKTIEGMVTSLPSSNTRQRLRASVVTSKWELRIIYMIPGSGSVLVLNRREVVNLPDKYDPTKLQELLHEISLFRAFMKKALELESK